MDPVKYATKTSFSLNVTVINGENLPRVHTTSESAYSVVLNVGNTECQTSPSHSGDKAPSWQQTFQFIASASTYLGIKVLCTHGNNRRDHVICKARQELRVGETLGQNRDAVCLLDDTLARASHVKTRSITLRLKIDRLRILPHDMPPPKTISEPLSPLPKPGPKFQTVGENWSLLAIQLSTFCGIAKDIAGIDSRAQLAMNAVSFVVRVVNNQIQRDGKIDSLAGTMVDLYGWLQDGNSLGKIQSFDQTVKKLVTQTSECAYFVRKYYETNSFLQRTVENIVSDADALISQFELSFDQLKIELLMGTTLQTALMSVRILSKVTNIENEIYLERLHCLNRTGFNPQQAAMRGTHSDPVIDRIVNWAVGTTDDAGYKQRVFLLVGPEGCGKSSIAHHIAEHFDEENRLGCGIFLHGGVTDRNSQRICGTIVRNLARYHPAIMERVIGCIRSLADIESADMERQFLRLIVDPLQALEMVGPVLVVIDGLEECETAKERLRVLKVFANHGLMTRLPANLRFLITARPAEDIDTVFSHSSHAYLHRLSIDPGLRSNRVMIKGTLKDLKSKDSPVLLKYGVDHITSEFLRRGVGDPAWGATACNALQFTSIYPQLGKFLHELIMYSYPQTLEESTEQLFTAILQALILDSSSSGHIPWNGVFYALLMSGSYSTFSSLPSGDRRDIAAVCDILHRLGIVQFMQKPQDKSPKIRFHKRFKDFLAKHNGYIDSTSIVNQHLSSRLAQICLDKMNGSLRHNMCALRSASSLDTEIADLPRHIEACVPQNIQYAVKNWISHVLDIQHPTDTLMNSLHQFLFKHLLHWIELLSVLNCLDEEKICSMLSLLHQHIVNQDQDGSYKNDCALIKDTINFIHSYGFMISRAHLYTYITALPLFPSYTLLHKTYIGEAIDERPSVTSNINEVDPLFSIRQHDSSVKGVSFSPDGSLFVSWSNDWTVCICDSSTGEQICPLEGPLDWVRHVVFSPDGKRVAGCGEARKVRVWDVQTGRLIDTPRIGHKDGVKWLKYSKDGSKLLSFSHGYNKICSWDVDTGEPIGRQSQRSIDSATFSPSGREIAMSSSNIIEIWDVELVRRIDILKGHRDRITRVVWSSNGSKIASASEDGTVRLWHADKRADPVVFNLGDVKRIHSLSFSGDTYHLSLAASISGLILLYIWDLRSTAYHRDTRMISSRNLKCMDVFLDTGQIVAGTGDGEILMWDINTIPTLSLQTIRLDITTPTIRYHGPFHILKSAHHTDFEGWVRTKDGRRLIWVPGVGSYTIKRTTGKIKFIDDKGDVRLVMMESPLTGSPVVRPDSHRRKRSIPSPNIGQTTRFVHHNLSNALATVRHAFKFRLR